MRLFQFRQQLKKDLGGGECVATGAMPARDQDREVLGECVETVVQQFGQHETREFHGAQVLVDHAMSRKDARDFVIQKVCIEV